MSNCRYYVWSILVDINPPKQILIQNRSSILNNMGGTDQNLHGLILTIIFVIEIVVLTNHWQDLILVLEQIIRAENIVTASFAFPPDVYYFYDK